MYSPPETLDAIEEENKRMSNICQQLNNHRRFRGICLGGLLKDCELAAISSHGTLKEIEEALSDALQELIEKRLEHMGKDSEMTKTTKTETGKYFATLAVGVFVSGLRTARRSRWHMAKKNRVDELLKTTVVPQSLLDYLKVCDAAVAAVQKKEKSREWSSDYLDDST